MPKAGAGKINTEKINVIEKYKLSAKVEYCEKCVVSNQRPRIVFDEKGVCNSCLYWERKDQVIDWSTREKEFKDLCDRFRRKDGRHDVIVPSSGGKDSAFVAHQLKYKYKMNPLTVTWPPILYTKYGLANFNNWIDIGGFDNISHKPNGRVQKLLTKLSIENLLHPFQTFIIGQKNISPKIALNYNIPLIFYGENQAEYGNPIADNRTSLMDQSFYTFNHI